MSHSIARALSILGHPALVMPAAVLLMLRGAGPGTLGRAAIGFAACGALVMGWSAWQVRRGRWRHVDASAQGERGTLNRFLLVLLPAGAALAWLAAAPSLALSLGLAAAIPLTALLCARGCTLSLHVAFAAYAAMLLWRVSPWATVAGLAFAAAVSWSRRVLGRHAPRDLVAGATAGACAGIVYWRLAAHMGTA